MSYLSLEFLGAFLIFFALYWGVRASTITQNILLLIASYAFYASIDLKFLLILIVYTCITYAISELIHRRNASKKWLITGVGLAVLNLGVFKYFDFFRVELQSLLHSLGVSTSLPAVDIILPIGISFFTFQSITYLVSVYRKDMEPVQLGDYALFIAFFPTLLSGPICRANQLLPQLMSSTTRKVIDTERILTLILLALIKKLWIASWLGEHWVDPVFEDPNSLHGLTVLLGIIAYSIQIYVDFSGYTDLVTALALLLGFQLPRNFNAPYLAINIKEFWSRWHISLSTWIRDYIYIPLGGNQYGFFRTQIHTFTAMLISGLWHGSSTQFIIWGAIHGLAVVFINTLNKLNMINGLHPQLSRIGTFLFVSYAWVFFHANSLDEASLVLSGLSNWGSNFNLDKNTLAFLSIIILWYCSLSMLSKTPELMTQCFKRLPWWFTPVPFVFAILLILSFAPNGVPSFIYYQF